MLIKIILLTVGLLVLVSIGLAIKYYNQKRSPFNKKRSIDLFKKSELSGNENNKEESN